MAKGFYQALFLTRFGPTLNVNLTFTCFYMPLNFIDFACLYLREDIKQGLPEHKSKVFAKFIRGLIRMLKLCLSFARKTLYSLSLSSG